MFLEGGSYCNQEAAYEGQNKTTRLLMTVYDLNYAVLLDMLAIQMVIILYFAETTCTNVNYKNEENIDTWMDNVNQYSRTDLMQTNALFWLQLLYMYACLSITGPCL